MRKIIMLAMALGLLASGCASIVAGGRREINIKSAPTDAAVSIQERESKQIVHKGQTPLIVPLPTGGGYFKSKQYDVTISKDAYVAKTINIDSFLSGWYAGNIILWPVAVIGGLIIDPLTGAMWSLTPKDMNVVLETPDQYKERMEKEKMDKTKEEQKGKVDLEKQRGSGINTGWGGK